MDIDALIPFVDVPIGESGAHRVERFTITDKEAKFENMMSAMRGNRRFVYAGTYTRLMRGREVVMSDTQAEKWDHWKAVDNAKGTILINGLGIGMVLNASLLKPEVQKAFVVEKSKEVIDLVAPHYAAKFSDRFEVIHDDALEFKPPKGIRFGAVWHDIWDHICADNLESMKTLHRRYAKRCDWQGSWARELCRRGR